MKKISIYAVMAIVAVISFMAGITYEDWLYNVDDLYEANKFKRVLVDKQAKALDMAAIVIDNNDLLDTDGSDAMADYLQAITEVDSLYDTQK